MADNVCIFVDAGYVYAEAGNSCLGTRSRRRIDLDAEGFVAALGARIRASSYEERGALRTYWYDGGLGAAPTPEQREIGLLRNIKLRLGHLRAGGQRGVDSLIVRDLIVLANRHAMATAVLVAGDEDLREGVREAQDQGVQVVVFGIEPIQASNMSETLRMEADVVVELSRDNVGNFLRERFHWPTEVGPGDSFSLGFSAGRHLVEKNHEWHIARLKRSHPRIYAALDQTLLEHARSRLGLEQLSHDECRELRRGFWQGLQLDGS